MKDIIVIRAGHRPTRDFRMTTHIALISRALGASKMILTDISDEKIKNSIEKINLRWGNDFDIEMGIKWKKIIKQIKINGDLLIHLTMYGLKLENSIINKIKEFNKDVYIFVGSQKVPSEIYKLADLNIAITHQPQSECGALAIFLDRIFEGKNLYTNHQGAKMRIIPSANGKNVKQI